MKKSIEEWSSIYDQTSGTDFQKALALFQQYAGVTLDSSGQVRGPTLSALNRFFSGSIRRNHADQVGDVITDYLEEDSGFKKRVQVLSPETRTPAYLIFAIKRLITAQGKTIEKEGDLAKIIQVVMQKNNLTQDDIKDIAGSPYIVNPDFS